MKNRIETIINTYNLTAKRFSEKTGIQSSAVSHILTGRNNVSTEVIQKILNAFPNINAEWLVLGNGDMLKNKGQNAQNQNVEIKFQPKQPIQTKLFADEGGLSSENENIRELSSSQNSFLSNANDTTNTLPISQPQNEEKEEIIEENKTKDETFEKNDNKTRENIEESKESGKCQKRTIKRIIVLYSDDTFEEVYKA